MNKIFKDKLTLLDGAMGTKLNGKYRLGECPELLNLTNGELIRSIHAEYVQAGAEIIYSNTFGANSLKLKGANLKDVVGAGVGLAKAAAQGRALVALDVGPLGEMLEPIGALTFERAYDLFLEVMQEGQRAGADVIAIETIADLQEMRAAVLAAKTTGLPVLATMTFTASGNTFTGCTPEAAAVTLTSLGVDAVGANCSVGPVELIPIAKRILAVTDLPVVIKANAGMPRSDGGYDIGVEEFCRAYEELADMGVTVIGGCCGTTPDYIKGLKAIKDRTNYKKKNTERLSAVCSAGKVVDFGNLTVIGERINPTGKKLMKAALLAGDYDYVLKQAIEQRSAGADVLDVNCGLPELDEPYVMQTLVKRISAVCDIPLQIDSNNATAVERGLRSFCGRAIVNSVNGETKVLESVLPIVKKYGAMVVGLTLDEKGIANSVDERLEIADRILSAAKSYGISSDDVIIDPLTLTIATDARQAEYTIEAVKRLKERGIKTVLGVSNISYGMPDREKINAEFLKSAASAGLTAAIINPNVVSMVEAVVWARTGGTDSVGFNAEAKLDSLYINSESADNFTIDDCIMAGLKAECAAKTRELLKDVKPLEAIELLTGALDRVGAAYESAKLYLPQLIMAAEAAKAAFDVVRESLPEGADKGKIVLATVKGDVHDIGKNIVKAVLSNYGYRVIDLGKNIDEETIVNAMRNSGAKLLGLSALMTTTAVNMKDAIAAVRAAGIDCKIMVGGAVINAEYAEEIGADYYAKDANVSVRIAREVLG